MNRRSWILAAALVLPFLTQPAHAQTSVSFGPQLAWGDGSDLGIGARAEFGLGETFGLTERPFSDLYGSATATYFFCGSGFGPADSGVDCSYVELNGNGVIPFDIDAEVTPFAGAGMHLGRASARGDAGRDSNTEIGLNILGGLQFPLGAYSGFVEGKFGIIGVEQFVLSTGIMF